MGGGDGHTRHAKRNHSRTQCAKELRDIDNQFDKAELKLKIADLSSALADAKHGILDAGDLVKAKDQEIEALKETLRFKADTVLVNGYRYRKNDDGGAAGHAYCTSCASDDRWIETITSQGAGRHTVCPRCKADFGYIEEYPG